MKMMLSLKRTSPKLLDFIEFISCFYSETCLACCGPGIFNLLELIELICLLFVGDLDLLLC
jgi:hypothetical protein